MQKQITSLYDSCCQHPSEIKDLLSEQELEEILNRLVEKVWKDKGMPKRLNAELVKYFAEQLWQAITEGYGDDLTTIDFDTPDEVMLKKLQESIWHFSAAKNYTQLRQLSEALIGPDGKLREFNEFKREAYQINQDHVTAYLKTEYNFAVANGQLSSRWVDIQENKELFPNLEYSAVLDTHTSITCKRLDGVIRPVDDIFWHQWYPPNHWNCRSDVLQNAGDSITPLDSIIYPDNIPAMFKQNMAVQGLAFPEGHPYYIDNPDGVKATANKLRKKYGR